LVPLLPLVRPAPAGSHGLEREQQHGESGISSLLLSPDRASYRPTLAGSFSIAFPYHLSWDLTGSWEFLLLLALASSGPQVVGEMQSSLDRVRRQLSSTSTSTRHLLQGPLLKRSDTVNPLPSFPLLSGFQFGSCSLSRRQYKLLQETARKPKCTVIAVLLTRGYRCEPLVNIC